MFKHRYPKTCKLISQHLFAGRKEFNKLDADDKALIMSVYVSENTDALNEVACNEGLQKASQAWLRNESDPLAGAAYLKVYRAAIYKDYAIFVNELFDEVREEDYQASDYFQITILPEIRAEQQLDANWGRI